MNNFRYKYKYVFKIKMGLACPSSRLPMYVSCSVLACLQIKKTKVQGTCVMRAKANAMKIWINILYLNTQSQTWAGTTCHPLCLCPPPYPIPSLSTVPCKYTPGSDPPNLAQINFGPWELHSVIFPDPPLCLLIPLTANLITDGQEIQKSS